MKKFLKVLGAAALIAGFTPYQISGDKETGSVKVKALLWQLTSKPGEGEDKRSIDINFGFASGAAVEDESDLFSDELTLDYSGMPEEMAEETAEEVEEDVEEIAEEAEENVEEADEETDSLETEEL